MNPFRLAHAILVAGALLPGTALASEPAHAKVADPAPKAAKVIKAEDRIFKRPFSFPMAPRTRPSTRACRSLKAAKDC